MKVLFVCTGNAYRSPIAEALLKKLRSDVIVDSAGLNVAIPIPKQVRDFLSEQNALDLLKAYPESIDEKRLGTFDFIVAMESKHKQAVLRRCSECEKRIIVWNIKDPYWEYEDALDIFVQIQKKVKELSENI